MPDNNKEAATLAVLAVMNAPTLKAQSLISTYLTPEQAKHLVEVLENKLKADYTPPKPDADSPKLKR